MEDKSVYLTVWGIPYILGFKPICDVTNRECVFTITLPKGLDYSRTTNADLIPFHISDKDSELVFRFQRMVTSDGEILATVKALNPIARKLIMDTNYYRTKVSGRVPDKFIVDSGELMNDVYNRSVKKLNVTASQLRARKDNVIYTVGDVHKDDETVDGLNLVFVLNREDKELVKSLSSIDEITKEEDGYHCAFNLHFSSPEILLSSGMEVVESVLSTIMITGKGAL